MEKVGKLQEKVRLFGLGRDLKLVVDGETFYKRIGLDKKLEVSVGDEVIVEYEETKTKIGDWIADRVLLWGYGIPRKYREITRITRA